MPAPVSNTIELCVFKIEENLPLYLLLRRAENETLYPGIWQYITGSIQAGEHAVDAAYRELGEETSLVPSAFWVVPHVNIFYERGADRVNMSPLFAARVGEGDTPLLSSEHTEFGWYNLADASRKLVWPGQRAGLRIVHEFIVGGEEAAQLTRIR